ncbi:MAG: thiamine pyrophosphate-dependent dehydrogenase E1 component subunit alpha [Acidimicrobiales bacterium]|nr:thiamine pyrophosphate-dependent dehydrogenase E1 component subunit alpha [Acidimicrobiales bacterium]MBO0893896.1 thiamine pyrophosphate-dependent dehydrogenase E1 component subunit alpha [Acidimicrobiales bacterium]
MYERMLLIRKMEERLSADAGAGALPGGVHLYIGEEAVATGVCAHLGDHDWVTSTHRGHGHFLAKGGDPGAMMAEIRGKRNGICRGMGGSMHVADLKKGILGANGIVGGGLALATGAAFGAKLDKLGRVAVAFFGDGAANQGVLMENLNVSSLWELPLVFVCEHNRFSEFTPSGEVTSGQIVDRARPFGMPCTVVDGNDVTEVWRAAGEAVARARAGQGPSFIEASTYRVHGHFEAEAALLARGPGYRSEEEIEEWRRRDPIEAARGRLEALGVGASDLEQVGARVDGVVEEAVRFAEAGEPADPDLPLEIMFNGQRP